METAAGLPEDKRFWELLVLWTDVKVELQECPLVGQSVLLAPLQ